MLPLAALDAPSSSVCSAVRSQDRLPCASSPVSQGDCEARGCCYNPRDRVKTCYYGNTGKCRPLFSPPGGAAGWEASFPWQSRVGAQQAHRWLRVVVLDVKDTASWKCPVTLVIATELGLGPGSVLLWDTSL